MTLVSPTTAVDQIDKEMRSAPGWQIHLSLQRIEGVYHMFKTNYRELHHELTRYKQPGITVDRLLLHGDLSAFHGMREVNRLAFNYLATSAALLDHTDEELVHDKGLSPMMKATGVRGRYCRERDAGPQAGLRWFMIGLRNYSMHRAVPLSLFKATVQRDSSLAVQVVLDTPRLQKGGSDWRKAKPGREYLGRLAEQEDATVLFARHEHALTDFYHWTTGQLRESFAADLAELAAFEKRLREAAALTAR